MAYPMVQLKPYSHFFKKMGELGVTVDKCTNDFGTASDANVHSFKLTRKVKTKVKVAYCEYNTPEDLVTTQVVRSTCKNLGIDPTEFGYELG